MFIYDSTEQNGEKSLEDKTLEGDGIVEVTANDVETSDKLLTDQSIESVKSDELVGFKNEEVVSNNVVTEELANHIANELNLEEVEHCKTEESISEPVTEETTTATTTTAESFVEEYQENSIIVTEECIQE